MRFPLICLFLLNASAPVVPVPDIFFYLFQVGANFLHRPQNVFEGTFQFSRKPGEGIFIKVAAIVTVGTGKKSIAVHVQSLLLSC
jgi:hypothetical protein